MADRKHFLTSCVDHSCGEDINEMVDEARQISYKTFRSHVDSEDFKKLSRQLGYVPGEHLQLHNDWAVSFYKSKFCGVPCYYFTWSKIEFIFT